jgi:hypothetical protein
MEVAREPAVVRVDVERVAGDVLVHRAANQIYALTPTLVALDMHTGKEYWQALDASGTHLWRAGRLLVVTAVESASSLKLAFVDPQAKGVARTCRVQFPVPREADDLSVHVFDRRGRPLVFWASSAHYTGGVAPPAEIEEELARADACGVMRIDPATCATSSADLDDFVWEPPEGREAYPGLCGSLWPPRDIPAAAAAAAPGLQSPDVKVSSKSTPISQCFDRVQTTLEVRVDGENRWSHPLRETRQECPAP